jgi:phosphoglycerate dehydrogenase-like enzyme
MTNTDAPRIHLGPDSAPDWLAEAIISGGAQLVSADEAEAIVWGDARNVEALASALDGSDHIRWVQLPFAGIENFVEHLDHDRVWTCGKGVYAEPVAEMALALSVAGLGTRAA